MDADPSSSRRSATPQATSRDLRARTPRARSHRRKRRGSGVEDDDAELISAYAVRGSSRTQQPRTPQRLVSELPPDYAWNRAVTITPSSPDMNPDGDSSPEIPIPMPLPSPEMQGASIDFAQMPTPATEDTPLPQPPATPMEFMASTPSNMQTPRQDLLLLPDTARSSSEPVQERTTVEVEPVNAQGSTPSASEGTTSKNGTPHQQPKRQNSVPLASSSVYVPKRYPPPDAPRRATRNSASATSQGNEDQKEEETRGENSVKASVETWITTADTDWTLAPPQLEVSLAQILPSDFTPLPWMHLTRHPIAWDGVTDAGGKSGRKIVIIGAAASKVSVNGRLPDRNDAETLHEGLHLLKDCGVDQKPTYSYALITRMAILGSPFKALSLAEIYTMLEAKYPWYTKDDKWRDSIRYNLSSNNWFMKTKRALHQPGLGNLWQVDEKSVGGPKRPRKGRGKNGGNDEEEDDSSTDSPPPTRIIAENSDGSMLLAFDSKRRISSGGSGGEQAGPSSFPLSAARAYSKRPYQNLFTNVPLPLSRPRSMSPASAERLAETTRESGKPPSPTGSAPPGVAVPTLTSPTDAPPTSHTRRSSTNGEDAPLSLARGSGVASSPFATTPVGSVFAQASLGGTSSTTPVFMNGPRHAQPGSNRQSLPAYSRPRHGGGKPSQINKRMVVAMRQPPSRKQGDANTPAPPWLTPGGDDSEPGIGSGQDEEEEDDDIDIDAFDEPLDPGHPDEDMRDAVTGTATSDVEMLDRASGANPRQRQARASEQPATPMDTETEAASENQPLRHPSTSEEHKSVNESAKPQTSTDSALSNANPPSAMSRDNSLLHPSLRTSFMHTPKPPVSVPRKISMAVSADIPRTSLRPIAPKQDTPPPRSMSISGNPSGKEKSDSPWAQPPDTRKRKIVPSSPSHEKSRVTVESSQHKFRKIGEKGQSRKVANTINPMFQIDSKPRMAPPSARAQETSKPQKRAFGFTTDSTSRSFATPAAPAIPFSHEKRTSWSIQTGAVAFGQHSLAPTRSAFQPPDSGVLGQLEKGGQSLRKVQFPMSAPGAGSAKRGAQNESDDDMSQSEDTASRSTRRASFSRMDVSEDERESTRSHVQSHSSGVRSSTSFPFPPLGRSATSASSSGLSISVPTSSSRTEQAPPRIDTNVALIRRPPSHDSPVASPYSDQPTPSPRLPSINHILCSSSPTGSGSPLPPIQSLTPRQSPSVGSPSEVDHGSRRRSHSRNPSTSSVSQQPSNVTSATRTPILVNSAGKPLYYMFIGATSLARRTQKSNAAPFSNEPPADFAPRAYNPDSWRD